MCFGGGSQPAAPTNPAPYSLENSQSAVEVQSKNDKLSMDDLEKSDEGSHVETDHANKATNPVTGGSGIGTPLQM